MDPDLEWTYLDPAHENPKPQTCHGRPELEWALRGQASRGLVSQLEEVTAHGDKVLVVVHTPGIDQRRARQADDRNYLVLTLQQDRIIAMRACRELKFGETYVNRENMENMQGFHAGWRKSGIGGADGKHGVLEYTRTHVIYLQYDDSAGRA